MHCSFLSLSWTLSNHVGTALMLLLSHHRKPPQLRLPAAVVCQSGMWGLTGDYLVTVLLCYSVTVLLCYTEDMAKYNQLLHPTLPPLLSTGVLLHLNVKC